MVTPWVRFALTTFATVIYYFRKIICLLEGVMRRGNVRKGELEIG